MDEALLDRSGRQWVPLRRSFTQLRSKGGGAGPLSWFVSQRRRRALDLYLLAHAAASSEPWDVGLPATVWARMLGLQGSGGLSAVSRQWTWLEHQRLISTHREDGLRKVTLLREDGSGAAYWHPGVGEQPEGDYFALPYAYWRLGLPDRIDLPTKAVPSSSAFSIVSRQAKDALPGSLAVWPVSRVRKLLDPGFPASRARSVRPVRPTV